MKTMDKYSANVQKFSIHCRQSYVTATQENIEKYLLSM